MLNMFLFNRYCLQMNSIVNVSQPLYGQLLEVQKKDDSNSTVSADTQATQKVMSMFDDLGKF